MNVYDSRMIASLFEQAGAKETSNLQDADIILINTCSVREHAERRALGRISSLQKLKRKNPGLKIGVIGCMAERLGDSIPRVDFSIGPLKYNRLDEAIGKIVSSMQYAVGSTGFQPVGSKQYVSSYPNPDNGVSAFLPVMRGCDNFCSYCIVPYVRGRAKSRDVEEILNEFRYLKDKGIKEVILLGQSINEYRYNGTSFPELLRLLDKDARDMRIRFLTSHPAYMSEEIINAMAECDSVCENIHLPIQSGCDKILKAMERRYTVNDYRYRTQQLRDRIKDIAITTDIIVGFPGEEEKDFEDTLSVVKEIGFDFAYMFIYSKREETKAAKMPDAVPVSVKKERLNRLIELQNGITKEKTFQSEPTRE